MIKKIDMEWTENYGSYSLDEDDLKVDIEWDTSEFNLRDWLAWKDFIHDENPDDSFWEYVWDALAKHGYEPNLENLEIHGDESGYVTFNIRIKED